MFFGYELVFETVWSGRTPGKYATGLQVVRTDGSPLTFTAAARCLDLDDLEVRLAEPFGVVDVAHQRRNSGVGLGSADEFMRADPVDGDHGLRAAVDTELLQNG